MTTEPVTLDAMIDVFKAINAAIDGSEVNRDDSCNVRLSAYVCSKITPFIIFLQSMKDAKATPPEEWAKQLWEEKTGFPSVEQINAIQQQAIAATLVRKHKINFDGLEDDIRMYYEGEHGEDVSLYEVLTANIVPDDTLAATLAQSQTVNAELVDLCKRALEELRLIRMKDCKTVYDITLKVEMRLAIERAQALAKYEAQQGGGK